MFDDFPGSIPSVPAAPFAPPCNPEVPICAGRRRAGRWRSGIFASAVWLCGVHAMVVQAAEAIGTESKPPAQALHRLLDAEWEWQLAQFPERATRIGDHRYDDRLRDLSVAAVAARRAHHRERLAGVRATDRSS